MRNSIVGGALALLLIGALFAAVHFGGRQTRQVYGEYAPDPSRQAAQIKENFQGERRIGDWKLNCGPAQDLPKTPRVGGRPARNPNEASQKSAQPSSEWKIPRCRVYREPDSSRDKDSDVRVTFRQVGFKRVLSLFLRLPHNKVEVNDKVTLRLDKDVMVVPVHNCEPTFCLVIAPLKKADASPLMTAKSVILSFTARDSGKQVTASVPTGGLAAAINAMCRIDK